MNVVEIIDENFKVLRTFSPDHKNIIDVSQPNMRLEWGVPSSIFFEKPEEEVSKRGGHFGAHSCAVDLKVVAIIKSEVIHGENHADEVFEFKIFVTAMFYHIFSSITSTSIYYKYIYICT